MTKRQTKFDDTMIPNNRNYNNIEKNIVVVVMFYERKGAFTRKKKNQLNILL